MKLMITGGGGFLGARLARSPARARHAWPASASTGSC
jgi:nucleoside-diphosphate-sugar epimerase